MEASSITNVIPTKVGIYFDGSEFELNNKTLNQFAKLIPDLACLPERRVRDDKFQDDCLKLCSANYQILKNYFSSESL